MRKWFFGIVAVCIVVTFFIYVLGLMRLFPLYLTAPPLFFTILFTILYLNDRNRFKGI